MAVTHHPKKNKRTPVWSMALLSAPHATTSFLSLSRPLISSGADLWGPPMPLVCRLGLSLMRKQAQRDGVTGLRSHSQKGRRGKPMTRTGLRGRKAMGVTVKARAWPPFLIPQGDSRAPEAGGAQARAGVGSQKDPNPPQLVCCDLLQTPGVAAQGTERLSHFLKSHSSKWPSWDVNGSGSDSKKGQSQWLSGKEAAPATGLFRDPRGHWDLAFKSSSSISRRGIPWQIALLSEPRFPLL